MEEIFQINHHDLPWSDYAGPTEASGDAAVRFKAVTAGASGIPGVTYVEYAPGHTDPVHSHKTGEFFIVTDGELWLDGTPNGPGSVVFVPRGTEYAARAGDQGSRFYRIVVTSSRPE
jgi:quercetin dioxygenase-like cupin family protein